MSPVTYTRDDAGVCEHSTRPGGSSPGAAPLHAPPRFQPMDTALRDKLTNTYMESLSMIELTQNAENQQAVSNRQCSLQ